MRGRHVIGIANETAPSPVLQFQQTKLFHPKPTQQQQQQQEEEGPVPFRYRYLCHTH